VGVHSYSSTDLYNWKDEGIALAVSENEGEEIQRGCVIERPKVIFNESTGKFVLWFHLELRGRGYAAARTAVAVADNISGPYRYLRSFRPNAGQWPENMSKADRQRPPVEIQSSQEGFREALQNGMYVRRDFQKGQMARDMTVFVDEDGKAYHIHASEENYTLHISELTDDYLDFTGRYVRVLPGGHNEAPAICKWQGKYWMITSGCTGWSPNAARSAVADSIWGPWTPLGNPCEGVNPANGLGPEKTFGGQSTFILPVEGKLGAFIVLFDEWRPRNPIDGRYIWLPLEFEADRPVVRFRDDWDLSVFTD
jgi:beta-xylosidase